MTTEPVNCETIRVGVAVPSAGAIREAVFLIGVTQLSQIWPKSSFLRRTICVFESIRAIAVFNPVTPMSIAALAGMVENGLAGFRVKPVSRGFQGDIRSYPGSASSAYEASGLHEDPVGCCNAFGASDTAL